MGEIEVVRTYLEMRSAGGLVRATSPDPRARVARMEDCPPSFFRYLYAEVGRDYHWVDRLVWSEETVREYLRDPSVSIWLLTLANSPAGYFELKRHDDGSVEIAYFGLLREFMGRGLGKYLLTEATSQAWSLGANRVWLHTCTLDDPAALPNYERRGFVPFQTETYTTTRSETPRPGPQETEIEELTS
jgi:GNAT superfamily N-acetyltransferase